MSTRQNAKRIKKKKTASKSLTKRRQKHIREKKKRHARTLRIIILSLVILSAMVAAIGIPISTNQVRLPVSNEVKAYRATIEKYCEKYDIPEYCILAEAVMMQESKGKGTDPMQSSEGNYNKKYSSKPGSIKDPEYSIQCGIHQLADAIKMAGCGSPSDEKSILLALQGYNYGDGYISWALKNYGGYSEDNAEEFSEIMQKKLGTKGYGDKKYAKHVMRYYSY